MISISQVSKQYKGAPRAALEDITLEIDKGEFVFLVGASGSGKSSLMRMILREDIPSSGSIHVLGENLIGIPNRRVPHFRRKLGVVFQDFRLLPSKTAAQNVAFSLEVIGKSSGFIAEAVPDVLRLVGLEDKANSLPSELSGGEQQRIALARAIVNKPAILLADEPTGNLDPATSMDIMALLDRINLSGTTIVMATHDRGIVDRGQKRVIELSQGKIIRDARGASYGESE
jgi:cell division transport system ATP-binding protein